MTPTRRLAASPRLPLSPCTVSFHHTSSGVRPAATAEILIAFFQTALVIPHVYDVRVPPWFYSWLDFLRAFDFDWLVILVPGDCVSHPQSRMRPRTVTLSPGIPSSP